ncbi:putative DegT/DnrJ/EryC1/StrS aminotransferase protein family [Magnetospirillum sp. XM-1]|uniref:DegT/DnrJ/EryC1/StrS family aminotransferase n=1 Tax=Magnetospirillum sp. XM-1 TaxID=1663591 RepID=UPI00073DCCCB|nr:DegT/DnrJ/EryC1/StrS family aminotransferase [Magnetospirillum sp. XM-1]CUW38016.1 putative DegT/DnrJ/EryC1/StrS aminotransferase protein family [Magnetospirillum sp. XM-1]
MSITVPFLDLRVADQAERQDLLAAVDTVLQHGRIVLGPEVAQFEARLASRIGRGHAVGVNSGTDALVLAIRAMGYASGDEIITTPLSFIATANAIAINGLEPVFADIGEDLCLDPSSIEALITPRTRAIIPVHWAGRACDMDAIMAIANRHGLDVIEDCAQAFGATFRGRSVGTFGRVGCFSMNCMKTLASLGEAGAVLTDDENVAKHLRALRYNGLGEAGTCIQVSHNGRLDTVQAAMLMVRLDRIDSVLARRNAVASFYDRALAGIVGTPPRDELRADAFYTYTILTPRRDELQAFLAERGIESRVQHLPLMPEQPAHAHRKAAFPNARRMLSLSLCIPASEKVDDQQMHYVAATIGEFFGRRPNAV